MTTITFPDVEAQQIDYLKATLTARGASDVWVGNHLPATIPARAVLVRYDGGPRVSQVFAVARVGYRVWDGERVENPAESFDLANLCSALVADCQGAGDVIASTATGPFTVEDPSGRPTHYFTAELTFRGSNI